MTCPNADYASDNFRWAENHADALCVFGMERRANGETLLALCNFADSEQKFTAFLPKFTILLDSNAAEFGGCLFAPFGRKQIGKEIWVFRNETYGREVFRCRDPRIEVLALVFVSAAVLCFLYA